MCSRQNQSLGNWEIQSQLYEQIEDIFLEPSDHGLSNSMSEFWNSWEDLSNNPESIAPRSVVAQLGSVLAETVNRLDSQISSLRQVADDYISNRITQVNSLATRVANINNQIISAEASGSEASEIRDVRDLLMDEMSKVINITTLDRDNGSMAILLGGRTMVDDAHSYDLDTQQVFRDGMMVKDIIWADDSGSAIVSGGEIAGLIELRDQDIVDVQQKLDLLTESIIIAVNDRHEAGYDANGNAGVPFFTGSTASDMAVNPLIMGDSSYVSASENTEVGGNMTARLIAALADENVAPGGTNIGTYYANTVNIIGTKSQSSTIMAENSAILVGHLEEQRESVSGISLDEETANLIRGQRAYESAAMYLSVISELMRTLMDIV